MLGIGVGKVIPFPLRLRVVIGIENAPIESPGGMGVICAGDMKAAGIGLAPCHFTFGAEEGFDFPFKEAGAGFIDNIAGAVEAGGEGADEV